MNEIIKTFSINYHRSVKFRERIEIRSSPLLAIAPSEHSQSLIYRNPNINKRETVLLENIVYVL